MWELLAVLGIYLACSLIGMAALWTVAIRKGLARAPRYFFWIRVDERRALPAVTEASTLTCWNTSPRALAAATAVLLYAVSTPQSHGWAGQEISPNQIARGNALIGS